METINLEQMDLNLLDIREAIKLRISKLQEIKDSVEKELSELNSMLKSEKEEREEKIKKQQKKEEYIFLRCNNDVEKLYLEGKTIPEISEILNIKKHVVQASLSTLKKINPKIEEQIKYNIRYGNKKNIIPISEEKRERIKSAFLAGTPNYIIKSEEKIGEERLKNLFIEFEKEGLTRPDSYRSKISKEVAKEIETLLKANVPQRKIAKKLNMSTSTIIKYSRKLRKQKDQ